MHILLTGGTGLIGRQLCQHWLAQGHRLTVWSREPDTVAKWCGDEVLGVGRLEDVIGAVDAVVNLAGAPIADRPWTKKRKALLWSSRISLTETLLAWMEGLAQKPAVLISGSAVGWYGDGGERELTEASGPVLDDFPSQLCIAWEETALRAESLGVRVVPVQANKRQGLGPVWKSIADAHRSAMCKMSTPVLTRLLLEAVQFQSPKRAGMFRPKLRYAHQGGMNPPLIVIHGNSLEHVTDSYKRFLEGRFRKEFKLVGTPLRIQLKTSSNPYADKD